MLGQFVLAVSMMASTIIGVGLFSLPYITLKVGIWVILGYFAGLGSLVILIHYLFAIVALKTPDRFRLPGFAEIHLGKWGKRAALVSTILGFFGALLAYLIVGGEFLSHLLGPIFGGSNSFWTMAYFLVGAIVIFFGIKAIAKIEFWGLLMFFAILFVIFFVEKPFISIANFNFMPSAGANFKNLFLPYGAILFSLWGASLIPEVEEMLGKRKNLLRKIIPISILIPIAVYLFFVFLILGITGRQTSESALPGLGDYLGNGVVKLGFVFGILTTFTSFVALGLTLKKTLWYDLKIPKNLAWAIACFVPLAFFGFGIKNFIPVISFIGGIMLGVDGILILLMYKKISKNNLLAYPLILIFLFGIVYEIIYFLK